MGRSTRRGPWLPDEDATLLQLVHMQGPNNWVRISGHMEHRSPKQCRERYHQNLKSTLNHEPISNEEGEIIEQLVQEMGKRWAEIARRLGSRSDNAVKNWWNGSMNRRKRNAGNVTKGVGVRHLPIPATTAHHSERSYSAHNPPSAKPHIYSSTNVQPNVNAPANLRRSDQPLDLAWPLFEREELGRHRLPQPTEIAYNPYPPFRGLPAIDPSLSASSYQPSSCTTLTRHLQLPGTNNTIRPMLEHRPASFPDWPTSRPLDLPLISPATTEHSQTAVPHQPPSLVSDSLSHYSISPKTIPSPRPSMPTPIDTSNHNWYAEQRRNSYIHLSHSSKVPSDEGYVSALLPPGGHEASGQAFPLDPSLRRTPPAYDMSRQHEKVHSAPPSASKDSRMTLSNLLD